MGGTQDHWDTVYGTKAEDAVSWFRAVPSFSLDFLDLAGIAPDT